MEEIFHFCWINVFTTANDHILQNKSCVQKSGSFVWRILSSLSDLLSSVTFNLPTTLQYPFSSISPRSLKEERKEDDEWKDFFRKKISKNYSNSISFPFWTSFEEKNTSEFTQCETIHFHRWLRQFSSCHPNNLGKPDGHDNRVPPGYSLELFCPPHQSPSPMVNFVHDLEVCAWSKKKMICMR